MKPGRQSLMMGDKVLVYSKAQELDINDPRTISLVRDLSVIMEQALRDNGWGAVSSNNLCWNATEKPVRVVMVPHPENGTNITLVNPQTPEYGGWEIEMIEGCGSFPGRLYRVKRKELVRVQAYKLGDNGFTLSDLRYDARDCNVELDAQQSGLEENLSQKRLKNVSHIQHEIYHLDGIVIPNIGRKYQPPFKVTVAEELRALDEKHLVWF